MNYVMWESGTLPAGGFSPLDESVQPGDVIIYVDSPDITADLARAEALGAQIVYPKTEIPGTGWFGMFKDPTGNVIALYTSRNPEFNK
jgi:hypothetical protein